MIVLYDGKKTEGFNTNDLILNNVTKCHAFHKINGLFKVNLEIIVKHGDESWRSVVKGAIVKCAIPYAEDQLFRLETPTITNSKSGTTISVLGYHISYDLINNFLEDVRPVNMTGQQAGEKILSSTQFKHNFKWFSDVTKQATAYYVRKNVINALIDNSDNSFINRWNGELYRNNFTIGVVKALGKNNNMVLSYAKNILGFEQSADDSKIVTRCLPTVSVTAESGQDSSKVLMLPEKYIDSPKIKDYPMPQIKEVPITLSKQQKTLSTVDQFSIMRECIRSLYEDDKIDEPIYSYSVDFIELKRTQEYKLVDVLEEISIGDYVTIRTKEVNVIVEVVSYDYDCLKKCYITMDLGKERKDFVQNATKKEMQQKLDNDATIELLHGSVDKIMNESSDSISGGNNLFDHSTLEDKHLPEWTFVNAEKQMTQDLQTSNEAIMIGPNGKVEKLDVLNNPQNYINQNLVLSVFAKASGMTVEKVSPTKTLTNFHAGRLRVNYSKHLVSNKNVWIKNSNAIGLVTLDYIAVEQFKEIVIYNQSDYQYSILAYDKDKQLLLNSTFDLIPENVKFIKVEIYNDVITSMTMQDFSIFEKELRSSEAVVNIRLTANSNVWTKYEQAFKLSTGGINDVIESVDYLAVNDDGAGYAYVSSFMINTGNVSSTFQQSSNDNVETLRAHEIITDYIKAKKASLDVLEARYATIEKLDVNDAEIQELIAGNITANNMKAGTITAESGILAFLSVDTANIVLGAITSALIENEAVGTAQIKNASITDAKVVSLVAEKIISGIIDTSKVTIKGTNGNIRIVNNRLQVFDNQTTPTERVSLGDVNGDGTQYGFRVRGADGVTLLIDEDGVKREGITNGSIDDSKISTDADINGSKLLDNSTDGGKFVVGAITTRELATDSVIANNILAGAVTSDKVHADAIEGRHVKAGELTTNHVNSTFGSGLDISSNESITLSATKVYADNSANNAKLEAKEYAETLGDSLQTQIDGSITTYFFSYKPLNTNVPANSWTTTETKNVHLGDMFYDLITGYSYRFMVKNAIYSWERITDTDVTKALADASKAQDTADGKRRVFVVTPVAPYDVGDLWAQGADGDLMTCAIKRTAGFLSSEWSKANKYTDDTKANEALGRIASAELLIEPDKIVATVRSSDAYDADQTLVKNYADSAVDNLEIGGRNLIPHNKVFWEQGSLYSATGVAYPTSYQLRTKDFIKIDPSLSYMLSTFIAGAQIYIISFLEDDTAIGGSGWKIIPLSEPMSVTFLTNCDKIKLLVKLSSGEVTETNDLLLLYKFKLERGNKCTDWTPALEDVQGQIDDATTRILSAETAITQTANDITLSATQTKEYADGIVSDLEVGGRNLALDSNVEKTCDFGGNWIAYSLSNIESIKEGDSFCVSFEGKTSNGTDMFYMSLSLESSSKQMLFLQKVITDKWERYLFTFTKDSQVVDSLFFACTNGWANNTGNTGTLYIRNSKVERGNKYTDWTPAPEDVQGQIDSVENRVTLNESSITQNANSIALKVSQIDFDSLEIGGRNLIVIKNLVLGYWMYSSGTLVTSSEWALTDYIDVSNYERLIMSGYSNLGNAPSTCFYDANKVYISGIANAHHFPDGEVTEETMLLDQCHKMEIPINAKYARSSLTVEDIGKIKLESGNKSSDWTPAPEDVQGQIDDTKNRVSIAESSITQNADSIALKVTQEEFDNLEIGGRNLALDTEDFGTSMITTLNVNVENGISYITCTEAFQCCQVIPTEAGQKYVISALVRKTTTDDSNFSGKFNAENRNTTTVLVSSINWVRVEVTITSTFTGVQPVYFHSRSLKPLDIALIKVEKGTKATDWTPAPEDVQGQIDSVADRVSTAEIAIKPESIISTVSNSIEGAMKGLGMKVNYSTFTSSNSGELYMHGFNADGIPADIDGFIRFNGNKIAVKKQMINPNVCLPKCYIYWDNVPKYWYLATYTKETGTWKKNGSLVFTPNANQYFCGCAEMSLSENFTYASLWGDVKDYKQVEELAKKTSFSEASVIAQTASNIKIGFNGVDPNIQLDDDGILVSQGSYRLREDTGTDIMLGTRVNMFNNPCFRDHQYPTMSTMDYTYFDQQLIDVGVPWQSTVQTALYQASCPGASKWFDHNVVVNNVNKVWTFPPYQEKFIKGDREYSLYAYATPHYVRNTVGATVTAKITVAFYDKDDSLINTLTIPRVLTNSFVKNTAMVMNLNPEKRVGATFTAPSGTSRALVTFLSETSGSIVFSAVQLVEAYHPTAFIDTHDHDLELLKSALDHQVGMIAFFASSSAPSGWLKCNGALVSRTGYRKLFEVLGTKVGVGDGSTTFQLPDLRGEFIRGFDDGRGKDPGRVLGTGQGYNLAKHTHVQHPSTWMDTDGLDSKFINPLSSGSNWFRTKTVGRRGDYDTSYAGAEAESRPTNAAWLACIKY